MTQLTRKGAYRWQQVMWTGSGVGLLLTIAVLLFFSVNTVSQVMSVISRLGDNDLGFVFASIGIVTHTLLRLLAILVGSAVAFAGLAVSFFAHENESTATAQLSEYTGGSAKFALGTYAPGVVGVIVGALIIVAALYARGEHNYEGPRAYRLVSPNTEGSQVTSSGVKSPSGLPPLEMDRPSAASEATE